MAKALGHPARVRIVRLLAASDICITGDLVAEFPLA
jgi:DNA-binding transcriptional ArsR family regulator